MINDASLARFEPLADGLVKPIYADYSFGNIPDTIEFLLTGTNRRGPLLPPDCFGGTYPTPKKVVLIFVDSFGWQHWQQHQPRFRTTARVAEQGTLTPISTLFPSTTAASVTTLNLGVLPAVHACYEWNIYVPAYGEVIQSLAFAPLGKGSDFCVRKGYDPDRLIAVHETMHQRLQRAGVRSFQFSHRSYADSAFNKMANVGAEVTRHSTPAEALVQLKEAIQQTDGKAFFSLYWAGIDTIAHIYGPGTPYHAAEIASFWHTFDEVMRDIASPDTLYLFTADHGHVYADAEETIFLNEKLPPIAGALAMSPTRNFIYPNGSPRDVFLHVRPNRLQWTHDALHKLLADIALVMPMEDALAAGLFGPQPVSAELRRRLGDILILPRLGHFVWWREPGIIGNRYYGHHGGLTQEEATTVLGVIDTL